ncbi:UNVERIFIED_CONTAM: Alpha,alpha-trehalose-phosphate synthase [UDP-forming] 5 [Sesamum radiatum]|uniref:Alpha,alpha-trehalose-phosphate synthase [UDP-forming] 5 n=1 Tax=Sesamum radiatum TaxID=300843 RepID=A0AAW2TXK3_SESRA
MVSRSYSNLLDLTSGGSPTFSRGGKKFPRVATVAGVLSDLDDENRSNGGSDAPSSISQEHGLGEDVEVIYVGSLKEEIDVSEQDDVAQTLLETFKCVPAFIPPDLFSKFYHGFCKQHLWPLFHYMLPLSPDLGGRFDRSLWQAYVSVNKIFADKVMEVITPDDDFVWVHDYHLMNVGVSYQSKRGYIGLEYYGRTVSIKILPVGIHMGQLRSVLDLPETEAKVAQLRDKFQGKTVLLGVDDMDIFKGISLKLLAFEQLLTHHSDKRGKVVLVQIANPARGRGKDVQEVQSETYATVARINNVFGKPGYEPVVLIDTSLHFYERIAYYVIAECCLVTAVRDGMNLIPYEYIVCRQGTDKLDETLDLNPSAPKKSMLVVSEFIGCSPSLSGAIRVNPWNTDAVAEAMDSAMMVPEAEKQMRHEKHYKYVSSHDVAYWAHSFLLDLERACREHIRRRCWGIGFGLGFRVIALDPSFRKLSVEHIVSAYRRTKNRAILLDYDGTMTSQSAADMSPTAEAIGILNKLCRDPKNVVIVVSGKNKEILTRWFASCENLAIGAEHGYFLRPQNSADWETCFVCQDFYWKQIAEPVMQLYTETTDGSFIETKESALVWNYQLADPDFGSCQAKELHDHLESVLANEPVSVKSGQHIVEVKPQLAAVVNGYFVTEMSVYPSGSIIVLDSLHVV